MVSPWSMMLAEDLGSEPIVSFTQRVGRRRNELLFRNSLRQCSTPCVTCSPSLWPFKCLTHPQRPFAPLGGVKMVPCRLIVTTMESHVPCFPSDAGGQVLWKVETITSSSGATPHLPGSGWPLMLTVFEPKLLLRKKNPSHTLKTTHYQETSPF